MMLATEIDEKDYAPYLENLDKFEVELKLDGSRCIWNNGTMLARKRDGVPQQILNKKFPQIKVKNADTVVDGEIVVFNDEGVADFELLGKKENWDKAVFVIFDVIKFEGELVGNKPLMERKAYLPKIKGDAVKLITDFHNSWEEVQRRGDEGLLVKDRMSKYEFKRSKAWTKIKAWKHTELVFDHYENSDNPNWKGIVLISEGKDRVACAGAQSEPIKAKLDKGEKVTLPIRYLMKLQSGKLRHPTIHNG